MNNYEITIRSKTFRFSKKETIFHSGLNILAEIVFENLINLKWEKNQTPVMFKLKRKNTTN